MLVYKNNVNFPEINLIHIICNCVLCFQIVRIRTHRRTIKIQTLTSVERDEIYLLKLLNMAFL